MAWFVIDPTSASVSVPQRCASASASMGNGTTLAKGEALFMRADVEEPAPAVS